MQINRAYRYELDPNVQQRILLAKHAGTARFAYNWGLARRIELYQQGKRDSPPKTHLKHLYTKTGTADRKELILLVMKRSASQKPAGEQEVTASDKNWGITP